MVYGFFGLLGLVEEHRLFGGGSAKEFCTGDLRRTVDFQVVANGSQQVAKVYGPLRKECRPTRTRWQQERKRKTWTHPSDSVESS